MSDTSDGVYHMSNDPLGNSISLYQGENDRTLSDNGETLDRIIHHLHIKDFSPDQIRRLHRILARYQVRMEYNVLYLYQRTKIPTENEKLRLFTVIVMIYALFLFFKPINPNNAGPKSNIVIGSGTGVVKVNLTPLL